MSEIKALETEYNGYRFRSRLEARWAVFFDAAGIIYEYEQEGYELSDGTRYLPDFYLPDFDTHVEVKGNRKQAWDEIRKAKKSIEWGGPIKRILILSDIPKDFGWRTGIYHFPCFHWSGIGDCVIAGWWFFYQDSDNKCFGKISGTNYLRPVLENDGSLPKRRKQTSFQAISDMQLRSEIGIDTSTPAIYKDIEQAYWEFVYNDNKLLFDALKKARQARFEHGEKPNIRR